MTAENLSHHQITATEQSLNASTDFDHTGLTTTTIAPNMITVPTLTVSVATGTSKTPVTEEDSNCFEDGNMVEVFVNMDSTSDDHLKTVLTSSKLNNTVTCDTNNTPTTNNTAVAADKMVTFCNSINSHMISSDSLVDTTTTTSAITTSNTNTNKSTTTTTKSYSNARQKSDCLTKQSFVNKFLNCFRPFIYLLQKEKSSSSTDQDLPWEVPFESVTDLVWIGSGAQGVVFRGYFRGELIAVKKVNKPSDTDIRHLRYLNHPNVIKFRGVCVEQPCYCILMEYCPYGQLYELIHSGNPISPTLIYAWIKQIADGMHYLHSCKIIHRDLKSPNVLVGYDHVLKISDFGASREWTENSTKMSFTGTVAWMAPEIIRNEPCSFKVDVWSYGVLLWELLTGEVPYHNVDSTAILWGVGSEHLRLPVPMTCPTELRVLMKTCWNVKPGNRPSFRQILSHLNVTCSSLLQYTDDEFNSLRQLWKEEIAIYLEDIRLEGQCTPKLELMLIRRRREELCHAQDIRRCYDDKRERANELCMELQTLLIECEEEKRKAERERLYYETLIRELNISQQEQQQKHQEVQRSHFDVQKDGGGIVNERGGILKFADLDNNNNNDANVNRKQFPFSTLSTFSLGRKFNEFYSRYRNSSTLKCVKPTAQSLSLPVNDNTNGFLLTPNITNNSRDTTNMARNLSNRSIVGSMELLRNPYTLSNIYQSNMIKNYPNKSFNIEQLIKKNKKKNYQRALYNNDAFNVLFSNNTSVCPFCGNVYSNLDHLNTTLYYNQRRAFTLSMLEYEFLKTKKKLDLDGTTTTTTTFSPFIVDDALKGLQLSSSLIYSTRKQFASTNSIHFLVPPPPAYETIMKSPNMYKCHQYASQIPPPATLSSSSSATITNSTSNTTHACLINERDYGDYKSIRYNKRYRQTNLTANRIHTVTSSSLSMSVSPVMSVNYRIKTATTTTTNTSTTDAMMTTTATCVNKNTNTSLSISNNKIHSSVILNPLINFLPVNDDAQSKNQKKYKHLSVVSPSPSTLSSNYSPVYTVKMNKRKFDDTNDLLNPNSKMSTRDGIKLSKLQQPVHNQDDNCNINNVKLNHYNFNYPLQYSFSQDSLLFYNLKKSQFAYNTENEHYSGLKREVFHHLNKASSCISIRSSITPHTDIFNYYNKSSSDYVSSPQLSSSSMCDLRNVHFTWEDLCSYHITSSNNNKYPASQSEISGFSQKTVIQNIPTSSSSDHDSQASKVNNFLNESCSNTQQRTVQDGNLNDEEDKNDIEIITSENFPFLEHVSPLWSPSKCCLPQHPNPNQTVRKPKITEAQHDSVFSPKYSKSIPSIPRRAICNKSACSTNNNDNTSNNCHESVDVNQNLYIPSSSSVSPSPLSFTPNNRLFNDDENEERGNEKIQLRKYPGRRQLISRQSYLKNSTMTNHHTYRHHSRIYSSSQPRRNSCCSGNSHHQLDMTTNYRSTSFSASSSPISSTGTRTYMSIENLAHELQAHMIDSLSDKEYHVRRVRSRLRNQQHLQQPVNLTIDYTPVSTTADATSPLPYSPYSICGSNIESMMPRRESRIVQQTSNSLHLPNEDKHSLPRHRSIGHNNNNNNFNNNNANSHLCTPNSMVLITSTCTTISSITEVSSFMKFVLF
ncbi:unnamed protein product [Trichobilharzia szidati]|nr:unnamed protein product [Trichobilharzia szidati]